MAARRRASPSTRASEYVRDEIYHVREGKHGARSARQVIAIGLAKARRAGVELPSPEDVSEALRRAAARGSRRGPTERKRASKKRAKASARALKREGSTAASRTALARHAKAKARKRTAAERSRIARKASRARVRRKA